MSYIRAIFNVLPRSVTKRIREVIEFDGGVTGENKPHLGLMRERHTN